MSKKLTQPGKKVSYFPTVLLAGLFLHGIFSSLLLKFWSCAPIFRVLDLILIVSGLVLLVLWQTKEPMRQLIHEVRTNKYLRWLAVSLGLFSVWIIVRGIQTQVPLIELVSALVIDTSLFWALLLGLSISKSKSLNLLTVSKVFGVISILALVLYLLGLHDNIDSWLGYGTCGSTDVLRVGGDSGWLRSRGFVRNPNELGALLIIPTLLLVRRLFDTTRDRAFILTAALGSSLLLLFTFSRSSWLGLATAGLILLYFDGSFRHTLSSHPFSVAAILGTVAISSFMIAQSNSLINTVLLHKGTVSNSTAQHLQLKQEGAERIAKQPLGSGPGSAGVVGTIFNDPKNVETESAYLDIGVSYGWVGLLLLFCLLVCTLYLLYQAAAWPVLAGFVGLVVAGVFIPIWSNLTVTLLTGLLVGLSVSPKPSKKER